MNKLLKVLWFSNIALTDKEPNSSGTWMNSLSSSLVASGCVQLFNITQAKVKVVTKRDNHPIQQWLVPIGGRKYRGLPNVRIIREIVSVVKDINPDVIHIWGMEKFWGLLTARGYVKGNIILEIQGIKFAIEKYVYADLPIADVVRCFGIGELFRPIESLVGTKYSYRKWGKYEREMLTNHKIISTQSDWVRANVGAVTPLAKIVHTSMLLRNEFVQADKWEFVDCVPFQLFSFTSSVISYKGLHILIDALSILKKTYSNIKLVIAGAISTGVRTDGYTKWLIRRIKRLGLTEDIQWIGPLTAKEIVNQLHNANVAIIPSFVESYCMTLEESLFAGTPTVASFSGAMPELATNEESALFFSPGDTVMCARCIERILTDVKLATRLSLNSYNSKRKEDRTLTVKKQLDIYYSSLNNE